MHSPRKKRRQDSDFPNSEPLSDEDVGKIRDHYRELRKKFSRKEILDAIEGGPVIPAEAFSHNLSPLEVVVSYLKKEGLKNKKISELLKRSQKTISQASKEYDGTSEGKYTIPIALFGNRQISILESLVVYLNAEQGLKLSEISRLIGKDQRSLWTVRRRAQKKNTYIYSNNYTHIRISKDLQAFKEQYLKLKESGLSSLQINSLLDESSIPASIFAQGLAPLEALVSHLKFKGYANKRISVLLDRSTKTISQASKSWEKVALEEEHLIPLSEFKDRTLSILERVVTYLKEVNGLKYSEIGRILHKDARVIWTVYSRSKKKRGEANG